MKTVRYVMLLVIGASMALLVRYSYTTGISVGATRVLVDAMRHGAGRYDIFNGMKWTWGPVVVPLRFKRQTPKDASSISSTTPETNRASGPSQRVQ